VDRSKDGRVQNTEQKNLKGCFGSLNSPLALGARRHARVMARLMMDRRRSVATPAGATFVLAPNCTSGQSGFNRKPGWLVVYRLPLLRRTLLCRGCGKGNVYNEVHSHALSIAAYNCDCDAQQDTTAPRPSMNFGHTTYYLGTHSELTGCSSLIH
jgi:hypothetical protein